LEIPKEKHVLESIGIDAKNIEINLKKRECGVVDCAEVIQNRNT
jgi:hypothetical protein